MKHINSNVLQLRQQLSELKLFGANSISQIENAIELIQTTTIAIEGEIDDNDFVSPEEEIYFFRHIKSPLYSLQIAYRKILKIELLRPSYSKKEFKAILKQKLDFIQGHYIDYPEFTRYYNSTSTENDERYFLRSNKLDINYFSPFYDESNSTGYDYIAAYLLAYKHISDHYDHSDKNDQIELNYSDSSWSSDKLDLVELISGLHIMSSLNGGKSDLKTVSTKLCRLFNVEVKDFYGKRREIKQRKGEKFKYLREMLDRLEDEFDENRS